MGHVLHSSELLIPQAAISAKFVRQAFKVSYVKNVLHHVISVVHCLDHLYPYGMYVVRHDGSPRAAAQELAH